MVSNPLCGSVDGLSDKNDTYEYVAKFIVKHRKVFYCERSNGDRDVLQGWLSCKSNVHNYKYYTTSEAVE